MMILVHDTIYKIGCIKRCRRELRSLTRRVIGHRYEVRINGTARRCHHHNGVGSLQVVHSIDFRSGIGEVVVIGQRNRERPQFFAIDGHRYRTGCSSTHTYRQLCAGSMSAVGKHEFLRGAVLDRCILKQVSAAGMMTVVIDFVQTVIVVGRRIESTHESGTIHTQGSLIALGQKIASHITIRIARTKGGGIASPAYRTFAIEQTLAVDGTSRHLLQVVGSRQLTGHKLFVLQVSTITVNFYAVDITETSLLHQRRRQLIDTRRGHTDFHPPS